MKLFFAFILFLAVQPVFAGDINWSGRYRVESQLLHNPYLSSDDSHSYTYLQHHLTLSPEIVAADGLVIRSRFDIFNNADYNNSQFGDYFGGSGGSANTSKNRAATGEVDSGTLAVTDLYLTWNQQYGSLLVGRAPLQFGLGITHNAGNGEFDHWYDRRDLVAYKLVMGNFSFMPMYGKVKEGDPQEDDDIQDLMLQAMYENLDSDLTLGFFLQKRDATGSANDIDTTQEIFNQPVQGSTGKLDLTTYNFFVKKKNGPLTIAVEASMQSGKTGLTDTDGEEIQLGGYAFVGELNYVRPDANWNYDLKAGLVSGDDRGTAKYEGYLLNRNYEVAMILFNYVLGAEGSSTLGNENYIRATTKNQRVDVGQISNAIYLAPGFQWKWSDKWGMNGRFTYAMLSKPADGQDRDLGYELDTGVYYNPLERFHIRLDAGYLFAGDAFKGSTNDPGSNPVKDAYGIMTKAALSF
jgi:hypothetical protein